MEIRRRTRALCTALIRSASSVGVSEPMRADFACMPPELPLVASQAPSRRRPMINRRTFTALLAGTVAAPNRAWSQHVTAKTVFYASTGPELTVFDVDVGDAALQKHSTVTLPANVQYAWPHPSKRYLYVVSSSGGPGVAGTTHLANAFRIDPASGALAPHGEPQSLPSRPIHTSVDKSGEYLLTAYNDPSNVTVHRINGDGFVGEPISQPDKRGALTNLASIAPGTGLHSVCNSKAFGAAALCRILSTRFLSRRSLSSNAR